MMTPQYSVIIPAWNEEHRIAATLQNIEQWIKECQINNSDLEIVVVCDGCSDATEAVARRAMPDCRARVLSYSTNMGKGFAVRTGILESCGRIVAFMDADGSTSIAELPRLAKRIDKLEADIVIGSRRARGARLLPAQPYRRRLLGNAFSLFNRLTLNIPFLDTQCGFKVFRSSAAQRIFANMQCNDFSFDIELLLKARLLGYRVSEVGVTWHDVAGSKVHPIRDGLRMLLASVKLRAALAPAQLQQLSRLLSMRVNND